MKRLVHDREDDHRLVQSTHAPHIYYRVYKGTVRWKDKSEPLTAIAVLMQNGDTEDWTEAKARQEISFRKVAHILLEDLPKVLVAINELQNS